MSNAAAIQASMDAVYARLGVAASWTPAGGTPVAFTGLVGGGDRVAVFDRLQLNMAPRTLKARVSELAGLAPNAVPQAGDAIAYLDDATPPNVTASYVITGDPRREDPRRLEWTMELADG